MKRAILFTGLVRNEARFKVFLDAYAALPGQRELPLYFSTWTGELERYPALAAQLQALGAVVVEQRQPDLVLKGHALHQLATLELALGLIDDDTFVFKSRPDFADIDTFLRYLRYTPVATVGDQPQLPLPRHKFLVLGLLAAQPFYINDMIFAGMAFDMRRLPRLPILSLVSHFRMAPEQMIWAPQFTLPNSALDIYFRSNIGLIFGNPAASNRNQQALQQHPLYIAALAFQLRMLEHGFDFFDTDAPPASALECHSVEQLLWSDIDVPGVDHIENCATNFIARAAVFDAIRGGHCAPSPFGMRLQAALHAHQEQRPPDNWRHASADYAGMCAGELRIGGSKHVSMSAGRYTVQGAPPDWQQASLGTSLTQRLEEEINQLRRTLNETEKRLALAQAGRAP